MQIIIPTKPSRPVTLKDLWVVLRDSWKIKMAMRKPFPGKYPFAASISHCQIEPTDPLRFFVVDREGNHIKLRSFFGARIIMNPEILWRSKGRVQSREGCMSFPIDTIKKIQRQEIVEVKYWTFFGPRKRKFYMFRSSLVQHELDHMDTVSIYDRYKHKV